MAGVRATPEHEVQIRKYNYDYAEQTTRAGFLTITPDLRVFGERADGGRGAPALGPALLEFSTEAGG